MYKVNIMYELEPEYETDTHHKGNRPRMANDKGKNVKVSNKVFDLMMSEGLIKNTPYGYVFVGKYEKKKQKKI